MKTALTYDDITIVPKYSTIEHRTECATGTKLTQNITLDMPLVSSPMDTITESEMAWEMAHLGGIGFVHRFMSIEKQTSIIRKNRLAYNFKIGAAIGVAGDFIERAQELVESNCQVLLIDVANGHHVLVENALKRLKNEVKGSYDIIAGNVATRNGARDLCEWGADGVRAGIGGGSLCSTRLQTGVGIPMVTCIIECVSGCDSYNIPVMADGGIRTPGDVAKAIACGADTVMIGSLLSGTKEAPGTVTKNEIWPNETLQKKYRGSASIESKLDRGEKTNNIEGYSRTVPYKGKVKRIINDILDGLRSSMSYTNSSNIEEFQANTDMVSITNAGIIEGKPHLL